MAVTGDTEDPRRRLLVRALALGLLSGVSAPQGAVAQLMGSQPAKLPPGRNVYRVTGEVRVDGQPASVESRVGSRSTIETGRGGEIVYAVGDGAFLQRGGSRVVLEGAESESAALSGVRVLSGALLSVFASNRPPPPLAMRTANATVGVRGTGAYVEVDPEKTYFCTCYGITEVESVTDPSSRERIVSVHHDRPVYIVSGAPSGRAIRDAPFINHTDQELALIEAIVGRTPPFVFPKSSYTGPRRSY